VHKSWREKSPKEKKKKKKKKKAQNRAENNHTTPLSPRNCNRNQHPHFHQVEERQEEKRREEGKLHFTSPLDHDTLSSEGIEGSNRWERVSICRVPSQRLPDSPNYLVLSSSSKLCLNLRWYTGAHSVGSDGDSTGLDKRSL
jgi:hypothetical protein